MSKQTTKRGVAALLAGAVVASMVTITGASAAECYTFTRNLKRGSTGVDVMNLQKILNMDAATRVAASGAGSAGNETTSFGPATHAAVIKYQEKYASAILTPVNLTKGTGLVYASTRAHLTSTCNNSGTGTGTGTGTTTSGPVSVSNGAVANGALVAGQAGATLANFNFAGNGTVTNLELMRTGVSTNNTLKNVYLYDGATRLTDAASVTTDGKIRFNSPSGLFTVAGSKTISVRADVETGTANQTVGVMLSSMTPMGGSAVAVSNVMGNNLNISAVTTSSVTVTNNQSNTNQSNTNQSINAGLVNQNVWDANLQVSVREVKMKGLALKYIGSAPTDALSNLSLYVDGVKVGQSSLVNVNGSTMVTFDLMNSPVTLQTGTRLVQLRADVIKGTARSFQFQVQNSADYMLEDRDLSGVFVTPSNGTISGYNFQINKGSVTLNQDASFIETKVVGGATNAVISKFRVQAFGEDAKVETVTVTPAVTGLTAAATTTTPYLQNVTLYANGQAVGSSQNWTSGNLTFNLGSSMIIPAGATQTLEVRADVRDGSGQSYTAGTVTVSNITTTTVRGQSSQETYTSQSATGKVLTISTGNATFAKTGGFFGQQVSPNQTGVKIGSFTIQAGDAEDIRVTNMALNLGVYGGMPVTNVTNLKVTDSSTTVFNPVASSTAPNNFTMDVIVPKSTSKMFDVTADLGSTNSATSTLKVDATATYRGVGTGNSTSTMAMGVAFTTNNATIASSTITKLSSSPVSQLAVGGTTNQSIVTYNVKTVGGNGSATITEMTFSVAPSADAITKVMVGGKSAAVVGSVAKVDGLSIAVPSGAAGVDVPVTVDFGTVAQPGGLASQPSALSTVTLTDVKYNSGVTVDTVTGLTLASNAMQLVASKPTLTVNQTSPASGLAIGENKIGEVTVAADAKGNIKLKTINFDVTLSGITGSPAVSGCKIVEGTSGSIAVTGSSAANCSLTQADFDFGTSGYTVQAGQSKTFSVYATIGGTLGTSGQSSVSTKLEAGSTGFTWEDVNGGTAVLNGANIYNYPTNSWSVKN